MDKQEKKVYSSEFWYFILPIAILLILGFFVYVLFHMSSIQSVNSRKVFQILNKLSVKK